MKAKDFQEATAERIVEIFKSGQNRVLLADEVGLGKTIVARAVVEKVSSWHKREGDCHFKVIYICSNMNIANQNSKKLGIRDEDCLRVSESRLSMQHLKIYQNQGEGHSYQQLIPLTPATSFSMTGGCGNQYERALIYVLLSRLPAFENTPKLSDFMRFYRLKNWDGNVDFYEKQAVECDKNGSGYFSDMKTELENEKRLPADLIYKIKSICNGETPDNTSRHMRIINELRCVFAQISLDKLEPDLVIMDEFQRFRDLISPAEDDTETGRLSKKFLQDDHSAKVLLLSATPYKPYSTIEEIGQGEDLDHYREFMQVMDFLLYDKRKNEEFRNVWRNFSHSLSEIHTDKLTVLLSNKVSAEDALYGSICRTERFRSGIIDASKATEIEISRNDILSYADMQVFLNDYSMGNVPIDYIKSAPYLLSFMESYKLKENITREYKKNPNPRYLEQQKTLLLRRRDINTYKDIAPNNARLKKLIDEAFPQGTGMEKLLWLPPNKPYYKTSGIFSKGSDLSKVLVFSSWEMVPRMIACMLSYESEKRICQRLNKARPDKPKRYFAEENEIDFIDSASTSQQRRRRQITVRLKAGAEDIIKYPCVRLSKLYSPLEYIGQPLENVMKSITRKVNEEIERIKSRHDLKTGRGSVKDIYLLMRIFDGFENDVPEIIPTDAERLLAYIAIASPAVCAYRLFDGVQERDEKASKLAECFVSLFNKPESMDVIDILNRKDADFYYEEVLHYCVEGNLQAVLDEWAFVLGEKGDALLTAMQSAFIKTSPAQIDTFESFCGKSGKQRMRNHFAVGYFNARLDDANVQRTENIRAAFNSPFRPFVLATTSIGQEGLDFHLYCRKICHWNLPSNPVDLEQREGRINRYLCLAIRQSIVHKYSGIDFHDKIWDEMLEEAVKLEKMENDYSDLVPFWCLPEDSDNIVHIERIVPMYPLSRDRLVYDRLVKVLTLYRMTLGQPRQEELLESIDASDLSDGDLDKLFLDLMPWERSLRKDRTSKLRLRAGGYDSRNHHLV